VIKDDDTIVSGHRRWLALKALGIKAQCRVMTFSDELDEKESLIEFNKQRKKTPSQFFNEDKTLRDIYSERAKRRQVEAGKLFGENHPRTQEVPLNLAEPLEKIEDKGDTRDKVANAIGINRNTLETIREIGILAETGTTAVTGATS
jgi:ParB-like chromosome segregation protein Spo0J